MLKPEVGDYYMVYVKSGLFSYSIIEIVKVEETIAYYKILKGSNTSRWDFANFPNGVDRKLTPLEVELL
jgi:hypothetical protein